MHNGKFKVFHKYMHTSKMTAHKTHEDLEKVGLYRGQPPLLFALWKQDGLSGSELSKTLGIKPSTVAKMVKRLKNAGFVTTMQDPGDSRISNVYLTDKGRLVESDVNCIYEELNQTIFRDFDQKQMKLLEELLDKMQANILFAKSVGRGEKNE